MFGNKEFAMNAPSRQSLAHEKEKGLHLIILYLLLHMKLQLKTASKTTAKRNEHFIITSISRKRTALTPKAT